jgi:hypothetical protein
MALQIAPAQFLRIWDHIISASAVLSPAAVPAGTTGVASTITVTGAAVGDYVEAFVNSSLLNLILQGEVTAANTVTLKFANVSAGSITPPAAATYTVVVYSPTVETKT